MVWVVDTWVLGTAGDSTSERCLAAAQFLFGLLRGEHFLALDHEGEIQEEYLRNMDPRGIVAKWLSSLIAKGDKLRWYHHRLPERFRRGLEGLHFDRSDFKFVGVAYHTPDKLLVSEDSDYNPTILPYLREEIGISVLALEDALDAAI